MKIVGIISGGLDSFCFMSQFEPQDVYPITFIYSQKGRKEVSIAKKLAEQAGFNPIRIVDLSGLGELWSGTQLTDAGVAIEGAYTQSVVVPLRNAVFLTIAAGYAHSIGAPYLAYGAHTGDVGTGETPLYPDCSPQFLLRMESALNAGHFTPLRITSPALMRMSKADLIVQGYQKFHNLIYETWSCYDSKEKQCGVCESCRNRKTAFGAAGIQDLTVYGS